MQIRKPQLLCTRLFLVLLLGFSQASGAATQFPGRERAWDKIPTIVVLGQEGDWRNQLVIDGVDFWNKQLAEIGSGFRLGPVTFVSEIIPPRELAALSQATLDGERVLEPPSGLLQIEGDLIIALSDWAFVSFSMSFPKTDKRLIGIRSFQVPAFGLPTSVATSSLTSWAMRSGSGITTTRVSSCAVDPRLVVRTHFVPAWSTTFL
jgi:hypothetical protein